MARRKNCETRLTIEDAGQVDEVKRTEASTAGRSGALESEEAVRRSRIELLRATIAEGKYHIPSAALADCLVRRMLLSH